MKTLENMLKMGHENILYCNDEATGLKAIIAVHDTTLGPAIGGTRFYNYASEDDALYDVLRLSRGMTFKNAAGGLHAGGGKAVIIGDPTKLKTPELLEAYGRFVDRLNGAYFTAEDMNINEEDVEIIRKGTKNVVGVKEISGNPSPFTALGCYCGIKAAAKWQFGSEDLNGKVIAISGIGAVGYPLAEMLHKDGAKLIVADVKQEALDKATAELGAEVVGIDEIHKVECDIFAPCALGAVVSVENAKEFNCKVIAGSANNVLVDNAAGDKLEELGILYIPDYIINAGGVINCGFEIEPEGYDKDAVTEKVKNIYNTVTMILEVARDKNIPTYQAADDYALSIIEKGRK